MCIDEGIPFFWLGNTQQFYFWTQESLSLVLKTSVECRNSLSNEVTKHCAGVGGWWRRWWWSSVVAGVRQRDGAQVEVHTAPAAPAYSIITQTFPPVFKHVDISIKDIGPLMGNYTLEHKIMSKLRCSFISGYFGHKTLIPKPMFHLYLNKVIQYFLDSCFQDF